MHICIHVCVHACIYIYDGRPAGYFYLSISVHAHRLDKLTDRQAGRLPEWNAQTDR